MYIYLRILHYVRDIKCANKRLYNNKKEIVKKAFYEYMVMLIFHTRK